MEALSEQVEQLTKRVSEIERRIDGKEELSYTGSLRAFVESFEPESHTQRALVIAYYTEQFSERENFTIDDIKDGYRECRVKPPANMSDVLAGMGENDWLLRDGKQNGKQLWRLTSTAQSLVRERTTDGTQG
ncbi:hypothetical protein [Halogeometricum sp. CBA1124]|uniref:hypothetical protein n=1 Tax=Halogeometricum sp. CBA1124 TaxID=2668071 RepID=UPI00142C0BFF|nr:hypothetical protein [Halogeometricum sp. CBA1124]MUV56247.1 hypothetical protein [Halogeometricum sp. CBA1124]